MAGGQGAPATAVVRRDRLARAPVDGPGHRRAQGSVASPSGEVGRPATHHEGRRSGEPRSVIVGYYEDGPNFITGAAILVDGDLSARFL